MAWPIRITRLLLCFTLTEYSFCLSPLEQLLNVDSLEAGPGLLCDAGLSWASAARFRYRLSQLTAWKLKFCSPYNYTVIFFSTAFWIDIVSSISRTPNASLPPPSLCRTVWNIPSLPWETAREVNGNIIKDTARIKAIVSRIIALSPLLSDFSLPYELSVRQKILCPPKATQIGCIDLYSNLVLCVVQGE